MSIPNQITVDAIADPHVHLRHGDVVHDLIGYSWSGGADVIGAMPNTTPGLTTAKQVIEYVKEARRLARCSSYEPVTIMPFLMLAESTPLEEIDRCIENGIKNAKLYPKNRTVNSQDGIRDYEKLLPAVEHCGRVGMTCHFHPEHPLLDISGRDAEYAFVPTVDMFLRNTKARIVWEHGTDGRCVPLWEIFANEYPGRFYVTLTPHHLLYDDDMDHGDVTAVCKPPIKSKTDRHALLGLVAKSHQWVMLGSDSAFHPSTSKHVDSGCCACGAFVSPFLHLLCAQAFEEILAKPKGVDIYERFTSGNARACHGLPGASRLYTLERGEWKVPLTYDVAGQTAFPFMRGKTLNWKFAE